MRFDPQKHHRRSIRLRGYDYTQGGAYFVTTCVEKKRCAFGQIESGVTRLNVYGRIVEECWLAVAEHYPHVVLDENTIMPNHFHAIVIITEPVGVGSPRPTKTTLGQIMGYFKYQSTRSINAYRAERNLTPVYVWQRNYFERIVRNEKELDDTRRYIFENPLHWDKDTENPIFHN
jgi:REP element-mobilizing transposase RayT